MNQTQVVIAGAGPVGLVAALKLAMAGITSVVLEQAPELPTNLRASTFHPPTLDILDGLGVVQPLLDDGLIAPRFQYRRHDAGLLAEFDFSHISDLTGHPYRVQYEQFRLNRILAAALGKFDNVELHYDAKVVDVRQDANQVTVVAESSQTDRHTREFSGDFLIGADGAGSAVRAALGISFEGFTWRERFLVASTPFDYHAVIPDLTSVNYIADSEEWYFLLQLPDLWRVMFPTRPEEEDDAILSDEAVQRRLRRVYDPGHPLPVEHCTLYRVHQRVAGRYREGRGFIAGDAAHINNPLGGMGMNGGIHDAVNLTDKLIQVLKEAEDGMDPEPVLNAYEAERRPVALEYINTHTVRNKRNLETADPDEQAAFAALLHETSKDPEKNRAFLRRVSMLASLDI